MATGGGGRGTVLCLQCRVATHLPAQMPLLCLCSSLGLPSPGPCCCPWTGRTPWPSSPFSQSCIRMKGSRPFCVSLLHGFGLDSMSLTLPCDRPSTWGWWGRTGRSAGPRDTGHHLPCPPNTLRNHCSLCSLRGRGCLRLFFISQVPALCLRCTPTCSGPSNFPARKNPT